ncbi:DUF418 domain-containing protein [Sphingobacterium sp. E70]|uniref:DUF418 domain-containing protein n=1 Tax=Sphingobacterium sp. E70 TaxID=2853439 RepID=UPI00359C7887
MQIISPFSTLFNQYNRIWINVNCFVHVYQQIYCTSQICKRFGQNGQMTLTHYISHLTIGLVFFSCMINQGYFAKINPSKSLSPMLIFIISLLYFACSYYFSKLWAKRFKHGPFELLLRKMSA